MKKFVSGIIVGAILSFSVSAYGAEIQSFIGKEIQGQTTVYKDGEKLDTAIIVDGKSYAPTRSIGEAAGYSVSFEEGAIHLSTVSNETINSSSPIPAKSLEQINARIVEINGYLESLNKKISFSEEMVNRYTSALNNPNSTDSEKEDSGTFLPIEKKRLADLEVKKSELESELSALEADKVALEAQ